METRRRRDVVVDSFVSIEFLFDRFVVVKEKNIYNIVMRFSCEFDADQTTGIEQQSHDAQSSVRQTRSEASAPGPKENCYPGFDIGIAQVPRRISPREVHQTAGLSGWGCRNVAQNCGQKFASSGLAGESPA